jgi:hypothetical protein
MMIETADRFVNVLLALQIHFLAITERVTAFGAPSTSWVKMMVVPSL